MSLATDLPHMPLCSFRVQCFDESLGLRSLGYERLGLKVLSLGFRAQGLGVQGLAAQGLLLEALALPEGGPWGHKGASCPSSYVCHSPRMPNKYFDHATLEPFSSHEDF